MLDNSRSCHCPRVLVHNKVVLGGPCAETSPLTSQTTSIYLQRLDPSETSFRTRGVSQHSEHDAPSDARASNEGSAVGSWAAEKQNVKQKQLRHIHWRLGPTKTRTRTMFPGAFDRIVLDEPASACCSVYCSMHLGLDPWSVTRHPMPLRVYRSLAWYNVADRPEPTTPVACFPMPRRDTPAFPHRPPPKSH